MHFFKCKSKLRACRGVFILFMLLSYFGAIAGTTLNSSQQNPLKIEGQVKDESGQPMAGVSVIEVGTYNGKSTDIDGRFEITVSSEAAVLEFSFIGMIPQRIPVKGQTTLEVILREDSFKLEEIIVTGVASGTPKQKLGFSIEKVGNEKLSQVPSVDAASAIQGKVAGVKITKTSGAPGASFDIQLRGVKTIFGSSNPLVIVDGVLTEGGLSDVNSEDIESIEVLKGAAASSLYGSRAANGVISVITKRGNGMKAGATEVNIRSEFGKNFMGFVPERSSSTNRDYTYNGVNYTAEADKVYDNPYPKTYDQVSQFFNPGAYFTNYISLKGNSANQDLSTYVSFQNTKETGVVKMVDGATRTNFKINLDYKINDKFTLTTSNLLAKTTSDDRASGSFGELLKCDPNADLTLPNADGSPYLVNVNKISVGSMNPLYSIANKISESRSERLMSFVGLKYRPLPYLTFEGTYGSDRRNGDSYYHVAKGILNYDLTENSGYISRSTWSSLEETVELNGAFIKKIGDFNTRFKAQFLYEASKDNWLTGGGGDLGVRGFNLSTVNLSASQSCNSGTAKTVAYNYAGIAAIDYKDKYIFDALLRRDASSLFGSEVRWQTFYRVSGAWRLTQDFSINGVQEWKVRASYGIAGLRPPFNAQYETFTLENGVAGNGYTLGNKYLKPSFSKELEVGTDINFLDRFNFSFSYSDAHNTDQILKVPVPALSGALFQWQNAGEVRSTSWEFTLGGKLIKSTNLSWDVTATLDRVRQKITKLDCTPYMLDGTRFRIEEGITFGVLYLDKFARSLSEVQNQVPSGRTVDEYFALNNQGFVVKRSTIGTVDEKPIKIKDDKGNILSFPTADFNPDFNVNFTSTLTYKGFSLYFLLAWQQGGQVYNHSIRYTNEPALYDQAGKPWNEVKPIGYYENNGQEGGMLGWDNDILAFDATFLKLRELSLGYDFRIKKLENYVKKIRLSIIGRNLFTLTTYPGYDPETGLSDSGKGVDSNVFRFDSNDLYPIYKTFSGSLALTF